MEKNKTVNALCQGVVAEMEKRNYTLHSIREFRYNCNRLMRYMQEKWLPPEFTETAGAAYLRDTFDYCEDTTADQLSSQAKSNMKTVSKLGEYRLHGTFHSEIQSWTKSYDWAGVDKVYAEKFINCERELGKSRNTITARRHALRYFYEFLTVYGQSGVNETTGQTLSDYIRSRESNSQNYLCNMLTGLRLYFRFLFNQGYCENLEQLIPPMQRRKNVNVPALWSENELQQLLISIDRSNPTGKRNYAMLLLAVQLGLRTSDIAALKLADLNFDSKTIGFIQQKTGKTVTYPMLEDVGWAIIDWLRYGRPKIENPHVFLTCNSMPAEFPDGTALGSILHRCMNLSGIRKEAKGTTAGMHSLRHALARRLVESDTGLHDVVSIMGHRNTNATSKYTRTDIKGLRECALSIGGVPDASF